MPGMNLVLVLTQFTGILGGHHLIKIGALCHDGGWQS